MFSRSYFSGIFGRSPFKPLQEHMAKVVECTEQLVPLFQAVARKDFAEVEKHQQTIAHLEDVADDMKRELRLRLPDTLFLPVDRRDLLELLRLQDNIANKAKDIAGLILGRQMTIPEPMVKPFLAYVERSIDAARQAHRTVEELDELVETGFRGSEVELVKNLLEELGHIEKDTDNMQIRLRATLRGMEGDMPPVDVMFLYKIIELVGKLADLAERAGSRLQMMLAK
ncbi:MAG: TIGR00153 family protein [Ectothiorhodospiraceae bacterium]|nr:TIGR00153 family protein [Ectothiorhodospiraceae bacterium]